MFRNVSAALTTLAALGDRFLGLATQAKISTSLRALLLHGIGGHMNDQDHRHAPSPPRRVVPSASPALHLSAELLLQFVIADLDHSRATMRATVRQIAGQKVVNELINLGRTQLVVGLNRVATNRFCYDVLTQS